jgi:tol-pal system protein YbgF
MKSSIACTSFVVLSFGLALTSVATVAQNPAPVVDLSVGKSTAPKTLEKPKANVGDSYYQSQVLRDEVRELRGMVEQLSYELQRVKQRQMDDYLDIDRRLSAGASSVVPAEPAPQVEEKIDSNALADKSIETVQPKLVPAVAAVQEPAFDSEEIAESYAQASNLLLKKRDFDGAILAFKQHVADYPASPYAANAHYWLGEIYLLQGQDELARQAFTLVVEQHPSHGKALDANFKLGKIYHQLGEIERARVLLETAAKGVGGASNKAQSYLKNNF